MALPLTKQDLPPGWRLSRETPGAAVHSDGRFVAIVRPSPFNSDYAWSILGYTVEVYRKDAPTAFSEASEWIRKERAAIARRKMYIL